MERTPKSEFAAANAERKKQIADDSREAAQAGHRPEGRGNKTNKDHALAQRDSRKADAIEKLAHDVKKR